MLPVRGGATTHHGLTCWFLTLLGADMIANGFHRGVGYFMCVTMRFRIGRSVEWHFHKP
jgi:hypothetical protein